MAADRDFWAVRLPPGHRPAEPDPNPFRGGRLLSQELAAVRERIQGKPKAADFAALKELLAGTLAAVQGAEAKRATELAERERLLGLREATLQAREARLKPAPAPEPESPARERPVGRLAQLKVERQGLDDRISALVWEREGMRFEAVRDGTGKIVGLNVVGIGDGR